ncbi:MAG TPA: type II secretion system F family protein [Symbiobacteriaceae bacterium]|nr:type II secretion system F family protein [Symbiobacteriaceae bacterium]
MLILLLVFGATSITAYLALAPSSTTLLVKQRVAGIRRGGRLVRREDGTLVDEEMELPFGQRVLGPLFERISEMVSRMAPGRVQQAIALKLMQAGNPMGPSHFLGLQTLVAAGSSLAGLMLSSPFLGEKPAAAGGLMAVLLLMGWRLPEFWLSRQVAERRRKIDKALPDVLDLLSVSVEAGLGLDGAIQKVGEKFPEPTAGEFRELLKQIRLGTARADALRALADRTGLPDMRTFTAAVIQAEQLGVSISRVLRAQSEAVRVKRKQKIEERAMALPLKMLFPLILFIFPTIFIVVLGPMVINIITTLGKK